MHIAYSVLRRAPHKPAIKTTNQRLQRYHAYLAVCQKYNHEIAAIQKYLPDWQPTFNAGNL